MDGTLAVTLGAGAYGPLLTVTGPARLDSGSSLLISLPGGTGGTGGRGAIRLMSAGQVSGTFGTVSVATPGYSAVARYDRAGVTILISAA